MKVEAMREAIMKVYSGPVWRLRVQQMDDRQVIAIYKDMLKRDIFAKAEKASKMKEQGVQMTIWDVMLEEETKNDS